MTDAVTLYGTDAPIAKSETLRAGPLSFSLGQGALRHIRIGGLEIIRGVSFLVRDRDWGTLVPELDTVDRQVSADHVVVRLRAVYEHEGARLIVALTIDAAADALSVHATGDVEGDFETNRSGFTILHPAGLAGCPVDITHSDGSATKTSFPRLIDPWQPFMDITRMVFRTSGQEISVMLAGDTFETEDQRQWGDASYKTYNRPLAKPWPYTLENGSKLEQSVAMSWRTCETVSTRWTPEKPKHTIRFPETAILVDAADAARAIGTPSDILDVAPQRLLCSIDDTLGDVAGQCAAFAALQRSFSEFTFDLEAICSFNDDSPSAVLERLRRLMDAAGFAPASILVCPSVDRQSTPPGSAWPPCPPLEDIHRASAAIFPDLRRGGGMVTFFPELNRKRPPVDLIDFVSHALCPIVHAADDLSVMETLEAIPHITASARHIFGDTEYRIGPSTLAMRHNPYGERTVPNPDNGRVCMAHDDPRHRGAFGAAYTIGLACSLASSGIAVWTPAELYGPRGLTGMMKQAVAALARLSREPVHDADVQNGLGKLHAGRHELLVNLTAKRQSGLSAFGWAKTEY